MVDSYLATERSQCDLKSAAAGTADVATIVCLVGSRTFRASPGGAKPIAGESPIEPAIKAVIIMLVFMAKRANTTRWNAQVFSFFQFVCVCVDVGESFQANRPKFKHVIYDTFS